MFCDLEAEIIDTSSSVNYLLNAASPAFDKGRNAEAAALSFDQRGEGFPRIHNGTVDIEVVELQNNTFVGDPTVKYG